MEKEAIVSSFSILRVWSWFFNILFHHASYDAVDLKKSHPHEITFRLHGETHTLKAANDAERDGWFISLERAVEVGKAEKESIRASEGYKAEMEKLSTSAYCSTVLSVH